MLLLRSLSWWSAWLTLILQLTIPTQTSTLILHAPAHIPRLRTRIGIYTAKTLFQSSVYKKVGLNMILAGEEENENIPTKMSESRRQRMWKDISELEQEAVKIIANRYIDDSNVDNEEDLAEVHRLFAESAKLKNEDPYLQLSQLYAQAMSRNNETEQQQLSKQMSEVGIPPHIYALAELLAKEQQQQYSTNTVQHAGAASIEEVDTGSTFSDTVTDKIRIKVSSFYDNTKSNPKLGQYIFAYKVAIFNEGAEPVQVLARLWEIEKCNGAKEVVQGIGVLSTQPIIAPGEVYHYESACPVTLFPAAGKRLLAQMSGAYTLCRGSMGQHSFVAKVSKFSLILPEAAVGE